MKLDSPLASTGSLMEDNVDFMSAKMAKRAKRLLKDYIYFDQLLQKYYSSISRGLGGWVSRSCPKKSNILEPTQNRN